MRYTYRARIKRRRVVVDSYVSYKSTLAAALCTCNEKQAPTQRFRDVVAMESIARVRDLKVMPASFAAITTAACGFRGSRAGLCVVDFDV